MSPQIVCEWCRAQYDSGELSCPRCGAAAGTKLVRESGWEEAPPIPDLAKLQLGESRAQIEGSQVPVVDLNLAAGDSVYCTHDKLLWHDGRVSVANKKLDGAFKRMKAGLPLMLLEVTGPGRAAFSDNIAGELVPIPLDPGDIVVCREHHMLLATGNVDFDGSRSKTWFSTGVKSDDQETHWPMGQYIDRFHAEGDRPGLLLLHSAGNVFRRRLEEGEEVDIAPHALLAWMGRALAQVLIQQSGRSIGRGMLTGLSGYGSHYYVGMRVTGPGEVWMQSGATGETQGYEPIYRNSGITELI